MQDRVGDRDLADVVEQEAELDLRAVRPPLSDGLAELERIRSDALGVLAGVRVARLDRVGQRANRCEVGIAQLLRPRALLLERLAQVGRVTLELVLLVGGLHLTRGEGRAQALDLLAQFVERACVGSGHARHYPSTVWLST